MEIIEDMNMRVKRFSVFDVKLIQATTIFMTLIVVKFIPQVMDINILWFIVLGVIFVIKPFYVFFISIALYLTVRVLPV